MSSTSNVQNLLVNVFRPTYKWEESTGFVPSVTMSNISELIAGRIRASTLVVSDDNVNTYIGCNAGTSATANTRVNVAIGNSAMGGAVNANSNVAVGSYALDGLTDSYNNVAIGSGTDISSSGNRNVLIGTNVTIAGGSDNILIGMDLSRGVISNTLQIGKLLYGDLSRGFIGINTTDPSAALDISGIVVFRNKVGFQQPAPEYSLDVNGSIYVSDRFIGNDGTVALPLYTFKNSFATGMYVPTADASLGSAVAGAGAFGIAVNAKPAAIFSSNKVQFFQSLDVSGTFSACNVNINAFSVVDGSVNVPSMTFTDDASLGLYRVGAGALGITSGGVRRMTVLSNGDVSMNRLLATDVSLSGGFLSPLTSCNVIGGVTLCNGVVITSGTTATSNYRASNGTALTPAYAFISDPSTGLHLNGTSSLGFDTSGVQRMCISGGFVGIGTARPGVALEVVGDVSATTYNGPGGTASAPHYTSSDDRTTGVFFPSANTVALTAGGTERMRISNSNIGIGTTAPSNALDVSGVLRVIGTAGDLTLSNGSIAIAGVPVLSSTGVLSNGTATSNSIGGVTLSNTNLTLAGTLTGTTANTSNQIGGVTLSNTNLTLAGTLTGTTANTSNRIGGVTLNNLDICMNAAGRILAPLLRDAVTPTTYDISGGNISNSATTRSSNFRGNNGGVTIPTYSFASDPSTGLHLNGTSSLGFDTSGVQRMCISNDFVGIGTATPLGRLDIFNTGMVVNRLGNITASTDVSAIVEGSQSVGLYWQKGSNNNNCGVSFKTLANASFAERMRIDGNTGNIGIGTTAPQSVLDVSGTLRLAAGLGEGDTTSNAASIEVGGGLSTNGSGGLPAISFQGRDNAGGRGYRHFVRSKHSGGLATNCNAIQFYINNSTTATGSTGPGAGTVLGMAVTNLQRVGIATDEPQFALDVSGSQRINGGVGPAATRLILGPSPSSSDLNSCSVVQSVPNVGDNGSIMSFWTHGSNNNVEPQQRMTIINTGFVGINTTDPQYRLDVCSGNAGNPAINMNTWPRMSLGTVFYTRGIAAVRGCNMQYATPIQALDSNLGTVTNDTTYGTYFVCKRSGIWAITASLYSSIGNPVMQIDVSSGNAGTGFTGIGGSILVGAYTGQFATLNYTGYLPSNSNRFYRVQTNGPTTTNANAAILSIAFIAETPAGEVGFPL